MSVLFDTYQEACDKLEKIAQEARWSVEVRNTKYPVTFLFRRDLFPEDDSQIDGQQTFDGLDNVPDDTVPEIRMIFRDSIDYEMLIPKDKRLDDKFFGRLKSAAKEANRLYLLYWFSEREARMLRQIKPMFDCCGGRKAVCVIDKDYQP